MLAGVGKWLAVRVHVMCISIERTEQSSMHCTAPGCS